MERELIERALKGEVTTNPSLPTLSKEKWAVEITSKYGTPEQLMQKFCVSNQYKCATNLKATYFGSAPTLTRLRLSYGDGIAEAWLMAQIQDLYVYESTKYEERATVHQIEMTAKAIIANYGYLNMTEIMLFFDRFKGGRYGKPFGSLNGREINAAIRQFLIERGEERDTIGGLINSQKLSRVLEDAKEKGISHSDYELINTLKFFGYDKEKDFNPVSELEKIYNHILNYQENGNG